MIKLFLFLSFIMSFNLLANTGIVTGFDIPRFVSLKSEEANLRVGPSVNYPIAIKYLQKNLPIEVIGEFDVWRQIKDYENNIGWLHKSLIKGERYILTVNRKGGNTYIYNRPNGNKIGNIKRYNILLLKKCLLNWCKVHHKDINGWVTKKSIWGVYENEILKVNFFQPVVNQYWKILDSRFLNKFISN